ncbi:SDR family NAD(P)-dependent oxidoreductase [Sporobolomyces koalae]|uniref:SDR family NAD(P)-dependent oxidoreductase n=1 Tax=Sporobolomyces koalae TaxID=500713 RepID=UPI003171B0B2
MAPPSLASLRGENLFDLTGVVAVVTGGASGIGLMIASTLLANHAKVYIVDLDRQQTERIAENYSQLARDSGSAGTMIGLQADCGSKAEAGRLAEDIAKRESYVTVLFNNAGVMAGKAEPSGATDAKTFRDRYFGITEDDFTKSLAVNTVGPYFLSAAFIPLLHASKVKARYNNSNIQPQIINTSSMNGWTKDPATGGHSYPYLLSKAAIAHMTSLLAHDFLPLGIRVNQISPGWFVTGMSAPGTTDEYGVSSKQGSMESEEFGFKTPVGGSGTAKDVGSVALSLVVNRFVNGESILVDGGTLLLHPSKY